jgi:hypothetical protein
MRAAHTYPTHPLAYTFSPQPPIQMAQKEARLLRAMQEYQAGHISSIRAAAQTYNIPFRTLSYRLRGRASRHETRANGHKLSSTEEQALLEWILSMDARGYPPTISLVRNAALQLLSERVGHAHASIGVNWPTNFVRRQPALQARYTRKYDYQRAQCEDPELISAWFQLVADTITKYGIVSDDIYNFDETGFALGASCTSRVVTASDRRGRPPQIQPGDREWATVIEGVSAGGWALPPMVILKGKVHLQNWYEIGAIPPN